MGRAVGGVTLNTGSSAALLPACEQLSAHAAAMLLLPQRPQSSDERPCTVSPPKLCSQLSPLKLISSGNGYSDGKLTSRLSVL